MIDLDDPGMRTQINLVSNLVHYGHRGMVESVMVDGEFLMRNRRILYLEEVVRNAQSAIRHGERVAAAA